MDINNTILAITDLTAAILKRIRIRRISILGFEISMDNETESIDERIQKIEVAKRNLVEGLSAIEELETQAAKNQKDAQNALL